MWSGAWNKWKFTSEISNRFLASTVGRAWDWWSGSCENRPAEEITQLKYWHWSITQSFWKTLMFYNILATVHAVQHKKTKSRINKYIINFITRSRRCVSFYFSCFWRFSLMTAMKWKRETVNDLLLLKFNNIYSYKTLLCTFKMYWSLWEFLSNNRILSHGADGNWIAKFCMNVECIVFFTCVILNGGNKMYKSYIIIFRKIFWLCGMFAEYMI